MFCMPSGSGGCQVRRLHALWFCSHKQVCSNSLGIICTMCAAGKFSSDGVLCSDCAPGFVSLVSWCHDAVGRDSLSLWMQAPGSHSCSECAPGFISGTGHSTCTSCSAGTYNPSSRQVRCRLCPGGAIANTTGLSSCTSCQVVVLCFAGSALCQWFCAAAWTHP